MSAISPPENILSHLLQQVPSQGCVAGLDSTSTEGHLLPPGQQQKLTAALPPPGPIPRPQQ